MTRGLSPWGNSTRQAQTVTGLRQCLMELFGFDPLCICHRPLFDSLLAEITTPPFHVMISFDWFSRMGLAGKLSMAFFSVIDFLIKTNVTLNLHNSVS